MSCAGIFQLYASGVSLPATIALVVGVVLLAAVAPFPAYDRPARMRMVGACLAYFAAAAAAAVLALSADAGGASALLLALPAMGALLALWAFLTRKRKRASGVSSYHLD